jgi:hypothetical protein
MSNVLRLIVGFGIRTTLWPRRTREAIGEEDDGTIWKNIFFLSYVIWGCKVPIFNISPLPFEKKNHRGSHQFLVDLVNLQRLIDGSWVIIGDFNLTRNAPERSNQSLNLSLANAFNDINT